VKQIREIFDTPQDIEWASWQGTVYVLQTRPITTVSVMNDEHDLGTPEELFYWGPSRAVSAYMSDFMAGIKVFFAALHTDEALPNPPPTLVLFNEGKMVWLCRAAAFSAWTRAMFVAYEQMNVIDDQMRQWQALTRLIVAESDWEKRQELLVQAWVLTEMAEFSLYGAETTIIERFSRFDEKVRQQIWGAFTTTDEPSFLTALDIELLESGNPEEMAQRHPWVADGYFGVMGQEAAVEYFTKRLEVIGSEQLVLPDLKQRRAQLVSEYGLTDDEVAALTLTRKLITFMDERKKWMIQTRRLIEGNLGEIEDGWMYKDGEAILLDNEETQRLWETYVNFKVTTDVVGGLVASGGKHHFVSGEVVVISSPTEVVPPGKIVVVPATSPSYVPLMRTCKALITDHGGIMSHAAIIAREFGLPCIVGTKTGTKALQTGDQVLLDMVKGQVSKSVIK
jgi:phosphohistidine swiveling domain-containing protein